MGSDCTDDNKLYGFQCIVRVKRYSSKLLLQKVEKGEGGGEGEGEGGGLERKVGDQL